MKTKHNSLKSRAMQHASSSLREMFSFPQSPMTKDDDWSTNGISPSFVNQSKVEYRAIASFVHLVSDWLSIDAAELVIVSLDWRHVDIGIAEFRSANATPASRSV